MQITPSKQRLPHIYSAVWVAKVGEAQVDCVCSLHGNFLCYESDGHVTQHKA